ncbi:hypothetical protein Q9S78_11985 [Microbacterium sp. KSW-18]|uniref:Pyridoxamine 5'-phosphate oxidase putative domain-containing protein n=1 Tax=Microbacterium aquilitoris TaxID=3067307 RepID=A0ABU3GL11_9MICO|nr:hypothetical protein [Microbacterium sp. KSW-18]MDT3331388.1 hypothetical protein [Microbacterium sp. KSW-18]
MMDSRSLATRRVMKTVARRALQDPLPVQAADGSFPIYVALEDDNLIDVGRHVREYHNGRANVFVTFADHMVMVDFRVDPTKPGEDAQPAHAHTSMAMYVAYLRLHPGTPASVTVDLAASGSAVRELSYAF